MRTKRSIMTLWVGAASVAAMALSGIGASAASAACVGTVVEGSGSSLQKIAQLEAWIPNSPEKECVKYESTGSGTARTKWGAEKTGNKPGTVGEAPNTSGNTFIATDEALEEKQIKNLDEAAGATKQALTIPVVQAAIAMIVDPPVGCTVNNPISNANLEKVWDGTITEWSKIGTGCGTATIKRVVRQDVSGTTYAFKTYLSKVNGAALCFETWAKLAETAKNLEWPEKGKGTCTSPEVLRPAAKGGSEEVNKVAETEGTIGYANLADARAGIGKKQFKWLKVENKESSAWPGTSTVEAEPSKEKSESNCSTSAASFPTKAELETKTKSPAADDNWSSIQSSLNPKSTQYPICTLTYDVALVNYGEAGAKYGAKAKEEAEKTKTYLKYVTETTGGQKKVTEKFDYAKLPVAVQELAAKLVEKITP